VGEEGFEAGDFLWFGRTVDECAVEVEAEEGSELAIGHGIGMGRGFEDSAEAGDAIIFGIRRKESVFYEESVDFREGNLIIADVDIEIEESVALSFEAAEAAGIAAPPVAGDEAFAAGEGDDAVGRAMEDEGGGQAFPDVEEEIGVAGVAGRGEAVGGDASARGGLGDRAEEDEKVRGAGDAGILAGEVAEFPEDGRREDGMGSGAAADAGEAGGIEAEFRRIFASPADDRSGVFHGIVRGGSRVAAADAVIDEDARHAAADEVEGVGGELADEATVP
jgi:hypothetical protein